MTAEYEVKGNTYRFSKLSAREQWNVLRRVGPLAKGLIPLAQEALAHAPSAGGASDSVDIGALGLACIGPITEALQTLNDAHSDYIIDRCLSVVQRQTSAGKWVSVGSGAALQFNDIDMVVMLTLTAYSLWENLGDFFRELPGTSSDGAPQPA
jgi:hypothetical protein